MIKLPNKAKYVIIGAGIHGLSTAWHLGEKLKKNGGIKENDIVAINFTLLPLRYIKLTITRRAYSWSRHLSFSSFLFFV